MATRVRGAIIALYAHAGCVGGEPEHFVNLAASNAERLGGGHFAKTSDGAQMSTLVPDHAASISPTGRPVLACTCRPKIQHTALKSLTLLAGFDQGE